MDIPFLIRAIQYAAIGILFVEFIFAMTQRPSELQKYVSLLTVCCILMFIGYNIELEASNVQEALAGTAISYVGKPFIMLFSFLFICSFYGKKVSSNIIAILAIYCTSFSILVFFNDYHHLYYDEVFFEIGKAYSPLSIVRGPLYFSYVITAVIFFVACLYVVIDGNRKIRSIEKKKLTLWIVLMLLSGIGGYMFFLFIDTNGYDSTMLGVFVGVICLFILFTKYRIFDAISIAKEFAVEDSQIALIVLDSYKEILYVNEAGNKVLNSISEEELLSIKTENVEIVKDNVVYAVREKDIVVENKLFGKSFEIKDITDSYNYQSRLELDVKERTEQIEKIKQEVVGSIASIVEARSIETGIHILRTKEYVEKIAKELKRRGEYADILTDEYIALLTSAAPLHDIGKISVPDYILNKPGKLSDEEFEKMKVHTESGVRVIESSMRGLESDEYVELAEEIALYHHEKWDGSGYPKGLKGEEIPLSARIMAVADSYDALINERCYKPSYTKESSLSTIADEKSSHFDPKIVDAFMAAVVD